MRLVVLWVWIFFFCLREFWAARNCCNLLLIIEQNIYLGLLMMDTICPWCQMLGKCPKFFNMVVSLGPFPNIWHQGRIVSIISNLKKMFCSMTTDHNNFPNIPLANLVILFRTLSTPQAKYAFYCATLITASGLNDNIPDAAAQLADCSMFRAECSRGSGRRKPVDVSKQQLVHRQGHHPIWGVVTVVLWLIPAYKPLICRTKAVTKTEEVWPQ